MPKAPKYKQAPDHLLVDLDGTVINSPEYFAYAYRAMMHALIEGTDKPEKEVVKAMQQHYIERGIESPSLLQTLEANGFFEGVIRDKKERERLYDYVRRAYNASKTKRLRPYPGVPEVLHDAKKQGVQVIALTDAEAVNTGLKLKSHKAQLLGSRHFSKLIAIQDSDEPLMEDHEKFAQRLRRSHSIPLRITDKEKPDTDLEELLGMSIKDIRKRVAILGDNYTRDMELANRYGMRGYHAMWGVLDTAKHGDSMKIFTGTKGPLPNVYIPDVYPPNITPIGHPRALYDLLGIESLPNQLPKKYTSKKRKKR